MDPRTVVFCKVTNRVLYAADAVFDVDGNAYDPERVPKGLTTFDLDGGQATENVPVTASPLSEDSIELPDYAGLDDDTVVHEPELPDYPVERVDPLAGVAGIDLSYPKKGR